MAIFVHFGAERYSRESSSFGRPKSHTGNNINVGNIYTNNGHIAIILPSNSLCSTNFEQLFGDYWRHGRLQRELPMLQEQSVKCLHHLRSHKSIVYTCSAAVPEMRSITGHQFAFPPQNTITHDPMALNRSLNSCSWIGTLNKAVSTERKEKTCSRMGNYLQRIRADMVIPYTAGIAEGTRFICIFRWIANLEREKKLNSWRLSLAFFFESSHNRTL